MAEEQSYLQVKVVPGASRSRVAGKYAEGVKVQVSAAPEKGKANDAVIEVLAEWLGVKSAQVQITAGLTQPRKSVKITGLSSAELAGRINQL